MGIGQGYTHPNLLQLCVQASRLANGRKALHPRLVQSIGGVQQPSGAAKPGPASRPRRPVCLCARRDGRRGEGSGVAATAQLGLGPVMMAGKTGTAQARGGGAGGTGRPRRVGVGRARRHAWFIAFAPYRTIRAMPCSVLVLSTAAAKAERRRPDRARDDAGGSAQGS